ncbi:hypothetical protein AB0L25_05210 [Spirillospora sp. NPDC052242]
MTVGFLGSAALRLEYRERFETVDAGSGTRLAALDEVARVRSPRGSIIKVDPVATPRLTFALTGFDGTPLLYLDRAEHLKLYPLPPQTVLVGPDGTTLCRFDYEHHSPLNGGGRLRHDEAGAAFVPAVRMLDAGGRPLGDVLLSQTSWDNEKPQLADGQDARLARWVDMDGGVLAERRDGVLSFTEGLSEARRAMVVGSFLSLTIEYHHPYEKGKASESVPKVFPGYAGLQAAYDEYQLKRVGLRKQRVKGAGREFPVFREGVRSYRLEQAMRISAPIFALIVIVNLVMWFVT